LATFARLRSSRTGILMHEAYEISVEEVIEDLRANEGRMFRRLLNRLRWADHPEAKALLHTLMTHPDLRDLVPH
jgi:hypothetical protein